MPSAVDYVEKARGIVASEIDRLRSKIEALSLDIHSHPELAWHEVRAHQVICDFLESTGFAVTRHAHGIDTSFEAEIGSGGRLVVFCAEYDALPEIGHACGHNLIALSSIAAFVAAAKAIVALGFPGRVRILGTPAEEDGAGKAVLIKNGAFEGVDAAIMSHPNGPGHVKNIDGYAGTAGARYIAGSKVRAEFHGKPAHAAANPWQGVNALDAAVAAYSNISMMRQQIKPNDRIGGIIKNGGAAANIIPDETAMEYTVRSPTGAEMLSLIDRVNCCFRAAATATGCEVECKIVATYMDVVPNIAMCGVFVEEMGIQGDKYYTMADSPITASTDMDQQANLVLQGNVSQIVPSFHCSYKIPSGKASNHTRGFTAAAGSPESIAIAFRVGHGLAMLGIRILGDNDLYKSIEDSFAKRGDGQE